MAALRVACLTLPGRTRAYAIAEAMANGVRVHGDQVVDDPRGADVVVRYGWERGGELHAGRRAVYFDLPYWRRSAEVNGYYRLGVDDWCMGRRLPRGRSADRLRSFGIEVMGWNRDGRDVIVAGMAERSANVHGYEFEEWERMAVDRLQECCPNRRIWYRPKPKHALMASRMPGAHFDTRRLADALTAAALVVTHHSNVAIDALVAGVPVIADLGPASLASVRWDQANEPPHEADRAALLADVAWLQWSVDEMHRGLCWAYLKETGLVA